MTNVRHEIRREFATHELNDVGLHKVDVIRREFSRLLNEIEPELPTNPGRERSLMITHLEEACMFAIRAITTDSTNLK